MKNMEQKQRSANQIQNDIVKEKADKNDEELEKEEVVEEEGVGQETDTVHEEVANDEKT